MNTPSLFNLLSFSVNCSGLLFLSVIAFSSTLVLSSTLFKNLLVTLLGALANPTTKQWGNFFSFVFSKFDLTMIPFLPAFLPFKTTTTRPGL
jgi:hypothetical protein